MSLRLDYVRVRSKALGTRSEQRHGHSHEEAGEKPKSIMLTLAYDAASKHRSERLEQSHQTAQLISFPHTT